MPASAKDIIHRGERMKSERSTFNQHWQEIRDYIYPSAAGFTSTDTPGSKNRVQILDNTAEAASELLAAGLNGMLVNPATRWFRLRTRSEKLNKSERVAAWLEACTDILLMVFRSPLSGFAPQIHESFMDLVNFGTAGMFVEESPLVGPIFQARPLSELYVAENEQGQVDTVYRHFRWSARQAVQREAWRGKLPDNIVKAAASPTRQDDEFEFWHAIYPRKDRDTTRLDTLNMPFAGCYVSVDGQAVLEETGFPEKPMIVHRWSKRSSERYGRGPGMKALPDVKMLQRVMRATIKGAELAIQPPMLMGDDGVLSPVRLNPGGHNIVRTELMTGQLSPLKPLLTGARPDLGEELSTGIRGRIEVAFLNHLLQMNRDPRMTATQVIQLAEETLRVLGPVLGRQQVELLDPLIDRGFGICYRHDFFPPPPEELSGEKIEVEYTSPIANAQRLSDARGIVQTMEVTASFAGNNPAILDNIEEDLTFRHVADLFGWPKSTLRDPRAVEKMRKARQEEAEQKAQTDQLATIAAAAGKAAPALQALTPDTGTAGNA